jgi:hypothetical protein
MKEATKASRLVSHLGKIIIGRKIVDVGLEDFITFLNMADVAFRFDMDSNSVEEAMVADGFVAHD